MKKRLTIAMATLAMGLTFAAPAAADPDTAFTNELHTYGIYGQKDYNAWIGKITCKRIATGLDTNAFEAADFVHANLDNGISTEQAWQFLAAGLRTYCPGELNILPQ